MSDSGVPEPNNDAESSVTNDVNDGGARPIQVKLQFLAVGGAPILKKNKFQVRDSMTIAEILGFLRKTLKIRDGDPLFLYLNSSFSPNLEQQLEIPSQKAFT